ncbi:uncharacterized protein LOC113299070 [Papaver somniferum]|uniref:uncharacterized protein LOC113299070 n=1 Tax=Papaver somniferum TaxID=3469 RepID=UPI000E700AAD|nr:uncharacterized protein LOC113299070 [Papaver somniferum]XP_026403782.1 uncharacterized protein LOC113299070 [Papaver somniferum]XP_026403783.1 uncharacterized protein LOC113299070 [Papaver somniferum]XP_026403784.1 uncharacterized protein LOC113299070 [Papaver somniferum]XP_026403785.1 uncharacterized protein LOC113299070 [Papaver somniferum]XP_026403786.1 uncharacterized protein LOC113299070 [Papaver somniferum]XP_026403787.1 uncharacterized protein LOC113299070 [Papaver somniferum]XP_0
MSGDFTVDSAVECIREHYQKVTWARHVWHPILHPSTASNVWKIVRGICSTDEKRKSKGFSLASKCYMCDVDSDNLEHILWFCNFSQIIWKWLGGIFLFCNPESYEDVMNFAKNKNGAVRDIWLLVASITMMEIWFLRNRICFEEEKVNLGNLKRRIKQYTKDCAVRIKSYMWECSYDYMVFKNFDLKHQPIKHQRIIEVSFFLPATDQILICCDGSSRGNPGAAGYGFVCRDEIGGCIYVEATGLGIATNYIAELMAITGAAEWAIQNNKLNVCFNSDSKAAVSAYMSGRLPWFMQVRWKRLKELLHNIKFVHSLREVNFSADSMAKKGAGLVRGEKIIFNSKPSFIPALESPEQIYYRFC